MGKIVSILIWLAFSGQLLCQQTQRQSGERFPIVEKGKWGFIDGSGRVVIRPGFDFASSFSEGLALVWTGESPSFIDRKGETVFTLRVDRLSIPSMVSPSHFAEGLAVIATGGNYHMFKLYDAKYGYVDKSGQIAIRPEFDSAGDFSEGLAVVRIGQSRTAAAEFGYIDRTGRVVIQPQFYSASSFSEGLAQVGFLDENAEGWKHGFIDKTGKLVIRPQFSGATWFSEGLASVGTGGKHGYIDVTGQFAIPPRFEAAYPFSEGLAMVSIAPLSGKQFGYIDKRGQMVIRLPARALPGPSLSFCVPLSLLAFGSFSEGLANVSFYDEEGGQSRSGYIDKKGSGSFRPGSIARAHSTTVWLRSSFAIEAGGTNAATSTRKGTSFGKRRSQKKEGRISLRRQSPDFPYRNSLTRERKTMMFKATNSPDIF